MYEQTFIYFINVVIITNASIIFLYLLFFLFFFYEKRKPSIVDMINNLIDK
jgi:phosphatidylglycerophosphatase A